MFVIEPRMFFYFQFPVFLKPAKYDTFFRTIKEAMAQKEVQMDSSLFDIRPVTDTMTLCFADIPGFVSEFIGKEHLPDFRRKRGILLDGPGPLDVFFRPEDLGVINRFKVLKKQAEWMAGKAAVKTLAERAGLCPARDLVISAEKGGAPYLPDFPGISISISHSGDLALAAMDTGGNTVAVDIEAIEAGRMQNIMRVAFSTREIERYKNSDDATLYLNWTAKEAYLKYIKKGFAEGLKAVEIIDGKVFHHGKPVRDLMIDSSITHQSYALTLMYQMP